MSQTQPGRFAKEITPSDTVAIDFGGDSTKITRGVYVGSGGDLSVEMAGEDNAGGRMEDPTVVFVAVPSGTLLPIHITRVNSTDTSASSLVAVW